MFSVNRIGHFLTERQVDIVHAHRARDFIAASIAARISRTTGFLLTRHVMFPLKPFHKLALRNVDAAIAVSPGVGAQLEHTIAREKIHLIVNGLDINASGDEADIGRQFRASHGIPDDATLVGTLGGLKPIKGQRDFVLAAGEIAKTHPECRFVVAGRDKSIDRHFRRELRRLAAVLGLEHRFLWLDWLDDTAPFYAAIDVFVSPSHAESFGLAILEAMARGKAVVATETVGAKELLAGAGSLVPVEAPVEMAAAIAKLIADEPFRLSMGELLKAAATRNYPLGQMINATETLYRDVIAAKRT
jgi:glycosyltransferase involved in cell wall biosynthesis